MVYFEKTWVGYVDETGNFRSPRFGYDHWVLNEGGRYSTERTTNVAEGWNKEFNKITGKNPTVGFSLRGVYATCTSHFLAPALRGVVPY